MERPTFWIGTSIDNLKEVNHGQACHSERRIVLEENVRVDGRGTMGPRPKLFSNSHYDISFTKNRHSREGGNPENSRLHAFSSLDPRVKPEDDAIIRIAENSYSLTP